MATNSPVIMNPGEGKKVLFLGNEMVLKAVSRDSGGQFALVEFTMAAGFGGPPPHVHHAHDETFYVIEGEMRFRVDEREIRRSRARSHTSRGASGTRSGTRARSRPRCWPSSPPLATRSTSRTSRRRSRPERRRTPRS